MLDEVFIFYSKELQMYYANIIDSIVNEDAVLRERACRSVAQDGGLHALVPFFTQHVAEKVSWQLDNRPRLIISPADRC